MKQAITLTDNAASRIKDIMSKDENKSLGVRVGVKSGGCAGMSYVMEYAKEINPNDEIHLFVRDELKDVVQKRHPDLKVNSDFFPCSFL